jgi:multidrug efflux pump subunit AcrA (membrane-fusion protein)
MKQLQIRRGIELSLVLGLIALTGCNNSNGNSNRIGTVTQGDVIQKVTLAGAVVPNRRTVILPPYGGYVKKVYVVVGEHVQAGQPVISVVQSLSDHGEIFPLRSPFAGTVVQVLHSEGEYVEEKGDQSTLLRIDDLHKLFVMADVPELDLVKLREGQEVVIRASAILGHTFKGVIREISLAAREKKEWGRASDKVDFPIRIEVTDPSAGVRPGMSALIDVIVNKSEHVLTLKQEFVQRQGDKYFAILEDGGRRDIEVGLQNEEAFEIKSGLKEGERVRQTDFLSLSQEP